MHSLARSAASLTEATISAEAVTDREQIVSETPFGDREHTHDRWDGGSCQVSRPREEGQLERCARALEGLGVKLNQKQIQSRYILQGCVHGCLCV